MKQIPRTHRLFALMLALVMVLTMMPAGVFASGDTLMGDVTTVKVGSGVSDRENDFNKGWKFNLGDNSSASGKNFNDASWEDVDLPHDFSITQNFTSSGEAESGFMPGGTGWYRKSFTLDEAQEGKTFLLSFDGVYMNATVFVNGTELGTHNYGYTAFTFDITEYLTWDGTENVIAVKAVNNIPTSRWYSGSGIYRDVTLFVLDPVHVDLNGVTVTTPNLSSGDGTVNMKTELVNDSDSAVTATVTNTVYRKEDMSSVGSASQTVTISANSAATAQTSCVPGSYELWSLEDPNLYIVETQVSVNGQIVDTDETTFGFRWFTFSSSGFALNGRNVKLNGVCMHHDQGGLGSAAYYDAMYRQLSIMKEMGANAIRTAHNPADEQFIEICSELGLLVIEEVFDGITRNKNGNSNDFASYFTSTVDSGLYGASASMICSEYATRSVVKRDKNAASVFAWSFGNEIQEGHWVNDSGFATYSAKFIEWVNDEDGTRITTIGDNTKGSGYSYVNQALTNILNADGVVGFNYANDVGTLSNMVANWGGNHGCVIASETSSATNSRGIYNHMDSNSTSRLNQTSYDVSAVGWGITAHDSIYNTYQLDTVAGEFVWTGFDYIGEPTPYNGTGTGSVSGQGAIPNSSYFGIVDTTGFPKDSYYLYRSQWNKNDTTVHLVTAWDDGNMYTSGGKTPVWVYSNAAKVELYLNDALIGTTVRTPVTSAAGHTYYTYAATSNNSSVCTAANNSGADALYTIFNVAYTAGTLSTRAYNADGSEIALTDAMGEHTVTTPGTVTKLAAKANKTSVAADGSSLIYVEVDVTDASGNLDTTAANNITFSVEGPATIAAVDNGNQATTAKYQQSSVLTSDTAANINAYAGKALIILRSTEEAGTITLNIASSGLTGQTITVNAVSEGETEDSSLATYSMVRDYTIKAGTMPALDTAITGTLADGSEITGTIDWETVSEDVYGTYGDHTITGTATLGSLEIPVSAKLHVIPNIIDLRNVSTATMQNTAPTLPASVCGVMADGTLAGVFNVTWNDIPAASVYDTVGEIVTVTGEAVIFGTETMDVTCSVRVAEAVNTESENVAIGATLSQDIPTANQSDNLNSINDGVTNPGESTNDRWTNWDNRYNSDTATITMTWPTAVLLSDVNIYYRYDTDSCRKPESVVFRYSLDGSTFIEVGHTESSLNATVNNGEAFTYALDQVINPVAFQVTFTQTGGTSEGRCVGVYELETMTYAAAFETNSSADLSAIYADGTAIDGFAADDLTYEADQDAITADTAVNAGITVLPAYEGVVRILTVSEDGTAAKTYEVTVPVEAACEHANTELQNITAATCTTDGYTGDRICSDCGETVETGTVSAALGHSWSDWTVDTAATCTTAGSQSRSCSVCNETESQAIAATGHQHTELRNVSAATCEDTGYTGDTWCTDCNTQIRTGTVIAAKGHSWNSGVITKEPTETENGIKTFTCTACGAEKTEVVEFQKELKAPTVSLNLSVNTSTGRIVIQGQLDDFENLDDYYEISSYGIVYIKTSKIGSRTITLNTSGRTRVNFTATDAEGCFTYNLKPTSKSTSYAYRAFVIYKNPETGASVTVYSDMIRGSYNTFNK